MFSTKCLRLYCNGQQLLDQLNAPSLSDNKAEELVNIALAYRSPAAATYTELAQAINHCQTVNQVSALVNRITQHTPSTERQALYALQNARIEALKDESGKSNSQHDVELTGEL